MQLFEQRENWEVFLKDDRNKKAVGVSNKRNNHKEVLRRIERMQEKAEQSECLEQKGDDSTDEELDQAKAKRYANGKAKKEQKKQTTFEEAQKEIEEESKGKKKARKH